jgi:hypothetical protein
MYVSQNSQTSTVEMMYLWGICVKPNTQERFYKPGSDSVKEIGIYYPPKMAK